MPEYSVTDSRRYAPSPEMLARMKQQLEDGVREMERRLGRCILSMQNGGPCLCGDGRHDEFWEGVSRG